MTPARSWLRATPKEAIILAALPLVVVLGLGWHTLGAIGGARTAVSRAEQDAAILNESARVEESISSLSSGAASPTPAQQDQQFVASILTEASTRMNASFARLDDLGAPSIPTERARSTTADAINGALALMESEGVDASEADVGRRLTQAQEAVDALRDEALTRSDASTARLSIAQDAIAARVILLVLASLAATASSIATLNRRNRRETAALGGTLSLAAEGKMPSELDPRLGPLHTALNIPFSSAAVAIRDQLERMSAWARRSEVELRLGESFEGVENRTAMSAAVAESFTTIDPNLPMELMVTGANGRRLLRVASSPEAGSPDCPVDDGRACPAMAASTTLQWSDARDESACHHLRARGLTGSAVCVPLAGPGGPTGVIHATANRAEELNTSTVRYLETLAELSASRLTAVTSLEQTVRRATTDQLTGLANRRAFEERAQHLIGHRQEFILVMADLDHFKRLNDTHGHDAGDQVLKVFARVLRENVRRSDMAARYGGEEFLVLLPGTSITDALVTLDRVRIALATTLSIHQLPTTTASFGVARSTQADDLEMLLRVADAGLYKAKAEGRDRIVEASASMVADMFG